MVLSDAEYQEMSQLLATELPDEEQRRSVLRIVKSVVDRSGMSRLSPELVQMILERIEGFDRIKQQAAVAMVCRTWAKFVKQHPSLTITSSDLRDTTLRESKERERMNAKARSVTELHVTGFHWAATSFITRLLRGCSQLIELTIVADPIIYQTVKHCLPQLENLQRLSIHDRHGEVVIHAVTRDDTESLPGDLQSHVTECSFTVAKDLASHCANVYDIMPRLVRMSACDAFVDLDCMLLSHFCGTLSHYKFCNTTDPQIQAKIDCVDMFLRNSLGPPLHPLKCVRAWQVCLHAQAEIDTIFLLAPELQRLDLTIGLSNQPVTISLLPTLTHVKIRKKGNRKQEVLLAACGSSDLQELDVQAKHLNIAQETEIVVKFSVFRLMVSGQHNLVLGSLTSLFVESIRNFVVLKQLTLHKLFPHSILLNSRSVESKCVG